MQKLVLGALALVLLTTVAYAQTASHIDTVGFWGVLKPFIFDTLGVVVTALIGWVAMLGTKYFGITIEASHRDALHSAAMTGVTAALSKVDVMAGNLDLTTKQKVLDEAANWVIHSVPDALKYLGVTPASIAELVMSKLNLVLTAKAAVK